MAGTALVGYVGAASTVGLVLAQAIALYVGYGVVSRIARSTVLDALQDDPTVGGD